ncbi:TPA: hypothetical protein MX214_003992 [Citrobacter sedlakii]|nr:hypothetical protein [Citrobacter sedlakii]HCA7134006.1 hypothetical protein [Citrobacter sedlakii]HCA7180140.1 hypothetical protein [Citrobacter sedlakii]
MHRIDTATAQQDKFGQGKNGFTNGDPATGRRATDLNSDMWDAVQEEICGVIETAGIKLVKTQYNQLYLAIKKIIAGDLPDALLRSNNLSDVTSKEVSLSNLNGVPKTLKINGKALSSDINITSADVGALPTTGGKVTGEVKLTGTNVLRIFNADYGVIFRRSENNLWIIPTAKGMGENGDISALRPFCIALDTGIVSMTQGLTLGKALPVASGGTGGNTQATARSGIGCGAAATMSYSTASYTQLAGSPTEAASTKQLVDLRNAVYTKTESNNTFPLKDGITYVGLVSGNDASPYVRSAKSNAVITLATIAWVTAGFQPKGSYYNTTQTDARYQLKNTASLTTNGWHKDTSTGRIEQWGTLTGSTNSIVTVTFPIAFPNNCLNIEITDIWNASSMYTAASISKTKTNMVVGLATTAVYWRAIGN